MRNRKFNHIVMIGDIEFNVSGKYNPNYDIYNPMAIEYDEVLATIPSDGDLIEVDGKPLLESFETWDQLEKKVIEALEAEEEELLNDDDVGIEEDSSILRPFEDDIEDEY